MTLNRWFITSHSPLLSSTKGSLTDILKCDNVDRSAMCPGDSARSVTSERLYTKCIVMEEWSRTFLVVAADFSPDEFTTKQLALAFLQRVNPHRVISLQQRKGQLYNQKLSNEYPLTSLQ